MMAGSHNPVSALSLVYSTTWSSLLNRAYQTQNKSEGAKSLAFWATFAPARSTLTAVSRNRTRRKWLQPQAKANIKRTVRTWAGLWLSRLELRGCAWRLAAGRTRTVARVESPFRVFPDALLPADDSTPTFDFSISLGKMRIVHRLDTHWLEPGWVLGAARG